MRVFLDSIGCRLNQSEMDTLARQLMSQGHQLVYEPVEAELCIVNTCAVTREAERKSRQTARKLHRSNPSAQIALTGCYATLSPEQNRILPGVVQVVDNQQKEQLLQIMEMDNSAEPDPCWHLPGGRTRAFVKAQDGCDNRCTFCITTIARGRGVSRPLAAVVTEIQALEAAGYQEVVLTGVHLGSYAVSHADLAKLVRTILAETGIPRLRLSSLEPWDLPSGFFQLWQNPRLCRQLHLPLQSGSAAVLRRMARKTTPAEYRALATVALQQIPDLALTTDIIVGFPGETDAEFEASLRFIDELDLARLHVFGYSPRPGTAAARMPAQVPQSTIKARSQQMRQLGAQKQEAFLQRFLGRTMEVLWESAAGSGVKGQLWKGHTSNYIQVTATHPYGRQPHNTLSSVLLLETTPNGIKGVSTDVD